MVKIKLYDYYDAYMWCYCGIGMGNNSAETVTALISQAVEAGEDIQVDINSGGGYVYDGFTIYNALLEAAKTVKVTTVNHGLAASIASIIFMAGSDRQMSKASLFMIHKPTIDLFWYGNMNADDLSREADALNKIQAILNSVYVDSTGLDSAIIDDMINAETWLTPTECEMHGFSTETLGGKIVKADILEEVMNNISKKAPENIRQYANKMFNTIENKMNKEQNEIVSETRGLLQKINKALFPKKVKNASTVLKNGDTVYHEGDLAVETDVFSDEEMTVALADGTYELSDDSTFTITDGSVSEMAEAPEEEAENSATIEELEARVAVLEAENISLQSTNATLLSSLKQVNAVMKKAANVSSAFKPKDRAEDFGKDKEVPKEEGRFANFRKNKKEN